MSSSKLNLNLGKDLRSYETSSLLTINVVVLWCVTYKWQISLFRGETELFNSMHNHYAIDSSSHILFDVLFEVESVLVVSYERGR